MRINTIINRYIVGQLFPPFLLNIVFLTFVFLMTRILDITNLIVNYKISLWDVVKMMAYTMPFFLEFVIPMSVMMSILLTFLRLSGDNEIVALKAGGVSLYGLLPPVFFFCIVGTLLTAFMAIYGLPWGRMAAKALAIEVAQAHVDIALKPRTFNDSFDNVMLYVSSINRSEKTLKDVFIEDQRTVDIVSTVVAPKGRLYQDEAKASVHLRLFNGLINRVDLKDKSVHNIKFDTYDIALDVKKAAALVHGGPKDEEEMSLAELRAYIKAAKKRDNQYYLTVMEWHKKFSLPFSCIALGLLAIPLGIQSHTANRSFGISLGLAFFLIYYIMLSAGWVFGEAGVYPPVVGMWVPNLVTGGLGAVLFLRAARERSIGIGIIIELMEKIKSRLPF